MRDNTLMNPRRRDLSARRRRQIIEMILAVFLFAALSVMILAGISFANGNYKAVFYVAASVILTVPALIYLNKQEAKR